MVDATILPDPNQLGLLRLTASDTSITAVVEALAPSTPCPVCGEAATRIHSRYARTVADLPWHGVAFRLQLQLGCGASSASRRGVPGRSSPNASPRWWRPTLVGACG